MVHIKITDLSVGDWVMYELHPYIVQQIDGESDHVVISGLEGVREKHIDYIEPICIKPEMLEKNGFKKNGVYNEWNIGEWNERPFIGVSLDRQSIRVKYFGTDIFIEGKVVYVHQLQHSMRLAGINKEIEL